MAGPNVEIKWPKEDLAGLEREMRRVQTHLGKDKLDAITMGAYYLARSAAARTKASPKKRRDIKNKNTSGRWNSDLYPYYRIVWKKGPKNAGNWYVHDQLSEEFKHINNSGLAKQSWKWMLSWIKRGGSNFSSYVERRISTFQAEIELVNKLSYINEALKDGDQRKLLQEAANAAEKSMRKVIDKRMAKLVK